MIGSEKIGDGTTKNIAASNLTLNNFAANVFAAKNITVSVIIVAYNSRADLERCLPTLFSQSYQPLEIIVVNNSPEDDLEGWLSLYYPSVHLIQNTINNGYAGGNNLGVSAAKGEFVFLLNPDTELQEGSLETLVKAAQENPDALITAKLLNLDGTINACGLEMHYTGITSCRGLNQLATTHSGLHETPLVSGGAFIVPKKTFLELDGFDEDYFMYMEDVDLSLRARLRGLTILCAGDAKITHHYELGMSRQKFYYLERNRLLTLFKLYQPSTLLKLTPALLLTELATWFFALLKGPAYVSTRWQSYIWLIQNKKYWQELRQELHQQRRVSDKELLKTGSVKLPLEQLVTNRSLSTVLNTLIQPLYRLCFRIVA
jgi:GT2 family glycosyltransferase